MQKHNLNVQIFQNRNWCSPKSDRWFFFTIRGKILSEKKKHGGTGLISDKTEALYSELNQRTETILQQPTFYNIFILCLWLRNIRKSNHGFLFMNFLSQIFLMILIVVIEQLHWRKKFSCRFQFIWLWLLITIMKRFVKRCVL